MSDISIRIEGSYNEEPFVFELDLRGDQEIMLDPPLVVTEEGGATSRLRSCSIQGVGS